MLVAESLPTLDLWDLLLRVAGAAALGGVVGLEREVSDHPAGLRTHVLVSLGAALFTLAGAFGLGAFAGRDQQIDPTRVAAQVVTGIGFLGAGAIIRHGVTVRGLTTAAGMWVTAAIGTAVGLGYWEAAIATTAVSVLALFGFKRLERRLLRQLKPGRFEFVIDTLADLNFAELYETLEKQRCKVDSVRTDTTEEGSHHMVLSLRLPPRTAPHEIAEALRGLEQVTNVDWTR